MSEDIVGAVIDSCMKANGWTNTCSMVPGEKIRGLDPYFVFRRLERQGETILMTDGCRRVRRKAHDYDEYLLPADRESIEHSLELLTYIAYFHQTLKSLGPANSYSLGGSFENLSRFTDLIVVAPYFLTQSTYPIVDGASRVYLNLCLPVLPNENDWAIQRDFEGIDAAIWNHKLEFFADMNRESFI